MELFPADEVRRLADDVPDEAAKLVPHWVEGPHNADRLDAAVVTVSAGGTTGRHLHIGGQIIYAISGRGWVEANGERVELGPGDLLSCPPGELHDHGAVTDSHFS